MEEQCILQVGLNHNCTQKEILSEYNYMLRVSSESMGGGAFIQDINSTDKNNNYTGNNAN